MQPMHGYVPKTAFLVPQEPCALAAQPNLFLIISSCLMFISSSLALIDKQIQCHLVPFVERRRFTDSAPHLTHVISGCLYDIFSKSALCNLSYELDFELNRLHPLLPFAK